MLFTTRGHHVRSTLPELLPNSERVSAWLRKGEGIVGWGAAASLRPTGSERFSDAQQWWDDLVQRAVIDDTTRICGTGPFAVVKMAYADSSAESLLVVPQVTFGRSRGNGWVTTAGDPEQALPELTPMLPPSSLRYCPGSITSDEHRSAVAAAVALIQSGALEKIVLGRDVIVHSSSSLDHRWILDRLARLFPDCWAFAVDGLLGASPELLLRLRRDRFTMLVLAGTSWPTRADTKASGGRLTSGKNLKEHAMAVESAVDALAPLSAWIDAPSTPSVLHLPNVVHLATRIRGRLATPAPRPLALVERLHPTAAVCGTPRDAAQRAITALEKMDRGGYLGPVGWLDADGNAEFAIALRCAQVSTSSARLFAGGGIVAGSTPDAEEAEVVAKLAAFQSALQSPLA